MFAIAMFHSISDGLTISSAGVAVGMVAPKLRQAGAQGLLGGVQTLIGGIAALVGGALYDGRGRAVAYTVCAVSMALLVGAGLVFAGRSIGQRLEEDEHDLLSPPATV
jgi:hypothetical protein